MKHFKLTFILTVLMSMVGLQAFADFDTSTKVEVGDFYYYLDNANSQAQVTSMPYFIYTGITIPSSITYENKTYSVTSIGDWAFNGDSRLTSVTIPNSVTSIGNYAFENCLSLKRITIGNGVTSIGLAAFYGCSGLTSIIIPNSVTSIGNYAFSDCSGLTSVTIGNSVTSIGYDAFYGCSGLTSVTIPNSVTSIGGSAFSNCLSLKRIIIGEGLSTLSDYVFQGCDKLEDIYCLSMHYPKNTSNRALNYVDVDYVWLHVPEISVKAYQGHEVWGKFKMIVPITAEEMETLDVKGVTIKHHDDTSTIYNLNGQRLDETKKGLNIINRRKVVMK